MCKGWNFLIKSLFYIRIIVLPNDLIGFQNQNEIDSLQRILKFETSLDEVNKVQMFNELSLLFRITDKDSSLYYASLALHLAEDIDNELEVINSLIKLGITHRNYAEPNRAIVHYRRGLIIARDIGNKAKVSSLVNNMANAFKDMAQHDSAIHYGLENLKIKLELGVKRRISQAYNNLGTSYSDNRSYKSAIESFKNSLLLELNSDCFDKLLNRSDLELSSGAIRAMNNLGNVYFESDEIDSAELVYEMVRKHHSGRMTSYQSASNYQGLGNIYKEKGDYERSRVFYDSSLIIYSELNRQPEIGSITNNIGLTYLEMSKFDSSIFFLDSANHIAEHINDMDLIKVIELNLSVAYDSIGDYKRSLEHIRRFKSIDSALYFIEKERNLNEIQTLYEVEKMEKDLVKRDALYQQAKLQRNIYQLSFGVAALVIILVLYRIYSVRKLAKQSKQLHNQEINELLANQELKMIQAMIEGEEKERSRVAEDLHDRLGSTLSATRMHLEVLEESAPKNIGNQTNQLLGMLDKAIEDTRQISHNLLSGVLTKFGLVAALKDLKNTVEGANRLSVHLSYSNYHNPLTQEQELHLFRVLQELVSNTLKHADAGLIEIKLDRLRDQFQILFSDNGKGFDTHSQFEGIGIRNIESRLKTVGATWQIESDSRGTKVKISLAA